jgi:hypothetical protein
MNNHAYAWFVRGAAHAAMCRTSVESVKKADSGARCYVVTDETSPQWLIPWVQQLHVETGLPIMLANLEAQVGALAAAWTDGFERLTFLDTDTLLLKPFEPFGDIAFTWRDCIGLDDDGEKVEGIATRMPYNYGVIVVEPGIRSFEAMIWLRERIRSMHANHQSWYGNQLAAAELAGRRPQEGAEIEKRRIPWKIINHGKEVQVGKLPCLTHNYTPQNATEDLGGKYVLHFKGGKRSLMKVYAQRLGLNWYGE